MDLRILEIASNTENNKILAKHTHKSKNKNPMCGDVMEISLLVKDNKVVDDSVCHWYDHLFHKKDNRCLSSFHGI